MTFPGDQIERPGLHAGFCVPDEIMTAEEVAGFLGIGRNSVYDAAGRQEIPHRRIGRRLLFSRSALLEWLACKEPSER